MKKIIFAVLCLLSFIGASDVLCWQVTEDTLVDGSDIQEFLKPYPSDSSGNYYFFPAARVKMISSDGTSSSILPILIPAYEGNPDEWIAGDVGVEPGNWGSGYWETGIVQSDTGYNTIGTIQGALHGETPSYPPEVMEALFIMELGYNEWDGVGDYVWRTLAESAPELYKDMVGRYMYAQIDIAPNPDHIWSPNFYTTPEPNTILLFTIGSGLLLLRRKLS